jgi:molybdate transport system substrate-binding protein
LKVLISGGFSGPYEQLLPQFERATGIKVGTGSGSSQGNGPQTIKAQLARGVPCDVVILSREGLAELIAERLIEPGTDADLARTPIGVAVRAGTPKPEVRSVEAFKQVMLKARMVAVPSSTSGIFLMEEVFPRLGIAGRVKATATPRGSGAAAMVASGEADLGLLPVSEIVHAKGVELAGLIAEEIQLHQVFAAAVVKGSAQLQGATQLIAFLASERAAPTIRSGGMEPLGRRS